MGRAKLQQTRRFSCELYKRGSERLDDAKSRLIEKTKSLYSESTDMDIERRVSINKYFKKIIARQKVTRIEPTPVLDA